MATNAPGPLPQPQPLQGARLDAPRAMLQLPPEMRKPETWQSVVRLGVLEYRLTRRGEVEWVIRELGGGFVVSRFLGLVCTCWHVVRDAPVKDPFRIACALAAMLRGHDNDECDYFFTSSLEVNAQAAQAATRDDVVAQIKAAVRGFDEESTPVETQMRALELLCVAQAKLHAPCDVLVAGEGDGRVIRRAIVMGIDDRFGLADEGEQPIRARPPVWKYVARAERDLASTLPMLTDAPTFSNPQGHDIQILKAVARLEFSKAEDALVGVGSGLIPEVPLRPFPASVFPVSLSPNTRSFPEVGSYVYLLTFAAAAAPNGREAAASASGYSVLRVWRLAVWQDPTYEQWLTLSGGPPLGASGAPVFAADGRLLGMCVMRSCVEGAQDLVHAVRLMPNTRFVSILEAVSKRAV